MNDSGKFIVFEGIDGSGKTTQMQMLAKRLKKKGTTCYATMEPTGGPVGSMVRQILSGRMKADNRVIAALCAADRLDHLLNETDGLTAKLEKGITVLSDRYYFSSYAYQGLDMPMDWIIKINSQCSDVLKPTVNIFIDIDADTAMERITKNRFHQELFEKKSKLARIRDNYFEAFECLKETEQVIVIDGTGTPEQISEVIWEHVKGYFYNTGCTHSW